MALCSDQPLQFHKEVQQLSSKLAGAVDSLNHAPWIGLLLAPVEVVTVDGVLYVGHGMDPDFPAGSGVGSFSRHRANCRTSLWSTKVSGAASRRHHLDLFSPLSITVRQSSVAVAAAMREDPVGGKNKQKRLRYIEIGPARS